MVKAGGVSLADRPQEGRGRWDTGEARGKGCVKGSEGPEYTRITLTAVYARRSHWHATRAPLPRVLEEAVANCQQSALTNKGEPAIAFAASSSSIAATALDLVQQRHTHATAATASKASEAPLWEPVANE